MGAGTTDVEGGLTTWANAKAAAHDTGFAFGEPAAGDPAWLFRFRGIFTEPADGFSFGPPQPGATHAQPSCRDVIVWFPDSPVPGSITNGTAQGPADGPCISATPLSRDMGLVMAAHAVSWLDPPEVTAELTTYGQALTIIYRLDVSPPPAPAATGGIADPVWLVTLSGTFYEGEGSSPPGGTPRPTSFVTCGTAYVIVGASTRETQMYVRAPSPCP